MIENEIQRLTAAINALRPDWPLTSLRTFITRNLAPRPYRDAAVALAWVAADPKSSTPARVLEAGPWWQAATAGDGQAQGPKHPPRREQECRTHPGQYADHCASCATERRTDEPERPRPTRPAATLDELREVLAGLREGACQHGDPRGTCGDCQTARDHQEDA